MTGEISLKISKSVICLKLEIFFGRMGYIVRRDREVWTVLGLIRKLGRLEL